MSICVCINAIGLNGYVFEPLIEGRTCLDFLAERLRGVGGLDRCLILIGSTAGADADLAMARLTNGLAACVTPERLDIPDDQAATAFRSIQSLVDPKSTILFCQIDTPLLSPAVSKVLLANHHQWHAEYSFADGYPLGFAPEVIKPRILGILATLAEGKSISLKAHDAVFETIKQDINAFEIETDIAPLDMRLLRIDLHCNSRQNTQLCRNVLPLFAASNGETKPFLQSLQADQSGLRTLPSFFNLQISASCPQVCPVCPWGQRGPAILEDSRFMAASEVLALARRIRDFAPESVVSVSMWGEPARHPEIWAIIEGFRELAPLRLYIETAGLGWDPARLEALAASGAHDHVTWIISLDSTDQAAYAAMRGEGWAEAMAGAHLFTRLFPQTAYVQSVRCRHNDPSLQAHYQYWKQLGFKQIIQKYDHFSGRLPDLRLSDISPIDRLACWHLKRDMAILLDGTVPLCRQDLAVKDGDALQFRAGNVFIEDLAVIWQRLEAPYLDQLKAEYRGICGNCDEYYTYNH